MKAMVLDRFGAADAFRWSEWPTPTPAAGEVRIRINAVSINPVDWKMRRGLLDVPLPAVLGLALLLFGGGWWRSRRPGGQP